MAQFLPSFAALIGEIRQLRCSWRALVLISSGLAITALEAPAQSLPMSTASPTPETGPEVITIRGLALDDSLNVPIRGLWLYLNDTRYGAITDERGEFTLRFPAAWKPVRNGLLQLKALPVPFTFQVLRMQLNWRGYDPAQLLILRLASAPGRGRGNLKGFIGEPAPVPPPVYPPSLHTRHR